MPPFTGSTPARTAPAFSSPGPRPANAWSRPGRGSRRRGQAFAVLESPAPPWTGAFLHRDFHPGNLLWTGPQITGVVDWVETSWGPADLDVAHAATYLSMLHGPATAEAFTEGYFRAAAHPPDAMAFRYWSVMDIVGYLPDPVKAAQPWRDCGIAITDTTARNRLEDHLIRTLGI